MSGVLTTVLGGVAGVCLVVGGIHLQLARRGTRRRENLSFGLLALALSSFVLGTTALYAADTQAAIALASRWQVGSICLAAPAFLGFVTSETRERDRPLVLGLCAVFAVLLAVDLARPLGLLYDEPPGLRRIALPFGGTAAMPTARIAPIGWVFYGAVVATLLVGLVRSCLGPRHRSRTWRCPLGWSVLLLLGALAHDALVDLRLLRTIYLGDFALLGLLLTTSSDLGRRVLESDRVKEALAAVAEGSAPTGRAHFEALVAALADALATSHAMVGSLDTGRRRVTTLAVWADGARAPDFEYDLAGTPCSETIGDAVCYVPERVAELYPRDAILREVGAESYLGVALQASDGAPLGLLVVMHRGRIDERVHPELVLRIFAARAAAELERLRAEAALRESEAQLQHAQKLEALGRLAGGVAHDFNNLVTAILGYGEFARQGLPEGDERRRDIEQIELVARNAAELTSQLLAFAAHRPVEPRNVAPNEHVAGLERMLRRLLGEDVELVVRTGEDVGPVRIDPGQLEQVLVNLVINARDATRGGGRITVSTREVEVAEDGDLPAGRYVRIEVADTGVGMDPATLERVFEPFFTTKPPGQGTGLGLATCYGIVRQAGGRIRLRSRAGRGTRAVVDLPRASDAPERPRPEVRAGEAPRGDETVLVLEDEQTLREMARRTLEERGYRVLVAASGEEALRVAREHGDRVDLLVTDLVLPGMDGREAARRLRAALPELRVLAVSGYDRASAQGEEPGLPFLAKPYTPGALARRVREVLEAPAATLR